MVHESGAGPWHGVQPGPCHRTSCSHHARLAASLRFASLAGVNSWCLGRRWWSRDELSDLTVYWGEFTIQAEVLGGLLGLILSVVLSTASCLVVFLFCFSNSHFTI